MKIEANINDLVYVKLTRVGLIELKKQHDLFNKKYPNMATTWTEPHVDENGYTSYQMWNLFHKFGHLLIAVNSNLPFETTIQIKVNK